jgi:membrane protein
MVWVPRAALLESVGLGGGVMGLQRGRRLVRPLWHAYLLWLRTDCIDLSAAFAYHTLQSIFPALLIGLSVASRWLGNDRQLFERLLHLLQQVIPSSSQPVVVDTLTRFLRQGFGAGVLGFVLLVFSANNIYLSLQRGADRLWWNRPYGTEGLSWPSLVRRFIALRLKAFALLVCIGPLIVMDQWISNIRYLGYNVLHHWLAPVLAFPRSFGGSVSLGLDLLISLTLSALVTLLLLWWLPSRRIPLRPLLPAACIAGFAITSLNLVLGRILVLLGFRFQAYGVVGVILLLSLWVWMVGVILYYGHCLAVVMARGVHARPPGRRSAPPLPA